MSNPFGTQEREQYEVPTDESGLEDVEDSEDAEDSELAEPDADVDVDASEADEVDEPDTSSLPSGKVVKKGTKASASTRAAVPDGYITPVAAAKKLTDTLTKRALEAGQIQEDEQVLIPPQVVYSYIRNTAASKTSPIPTYVSLGDGSVIPTKDLPEGQEPARRNLLVWNEFLAWWDEKDKRVAERRHNAAQKAAKKAAKAKETAAKTEATEAEGADEQPATEAE